LIAQRGILAPTAAATAALPLPALAAPGGRADDRLDEATLPCLVRSLAEERHYRPAVEGRIPAELRGTLFRNGPGIVERDGHRKRCLLDGDGMVQAFRFDADGASYQNRFVATEKYQEEQAAQRFRYQSWTTVAPGGWAANLGIGEFKGSAGVNAVAWGDSLYALEDASHPYRLDTDTLETFGEDRFGAEGGIFNAHPKIDPKRRQWIHTGIGVTSKELHVTIVNEHGGLVSHRRFPIDRGGYLHDCFVTDRHVVVVMSPVGMNPMGLLFGTNSVAGCFRWRGDQPNHVYVIERDGGDEITRIDAPAMWMWHSTNAFDRGGEIVADFVGYDDPDHFIGDDPFFWAVMEGRFVPARNPGTPTTNPALQCGEYRYGYYAGLEDLSRGLLHDRVVRIDMRTGESREYVLGDGRHCGETVFVPKPGIAYRADAKEEPGWLLTLVYDLNQQRSELDVFEAEGLEDGPVARVLLDHHTPFSFHGSWLRA